MSYIEGITLSGSAEGRMACDSGQIRIKAPVYITHPALGVFKLKDDKGSVVCVETEFRPSAYQLRKLADWCNATADDLEAGA